MSLRIPWWIPALPAMLLLGGCDANVVDPDDPASRAAVGRSLYLAHCSACHQHDGRGLAGTFPPLAESDWLLDASTGQAIDQLLHGRSGPMIVNGVAYEGVMPGFPHLADHEIAAILDHVYNLPGNDGRRVDPDEVSGVRQAIER